MASTTYARQWLKQAVFANEFNFSSLKSRTRHHFVDANKMYAAHKRFLDLTKTYNIGNVTVMVRNAGQLPQPFWLGAACGGGSCSFPASVARA